MKHQFQNLDIQCWEHGGKLGVSRPFICLQANFQAVGALLAAIDELIANGPPATRTLTLRPSQRPNLVTTIRMALLTETDDLRQMYLTRDGTIGAFDFTSNGLAAFRDAVIRWRDGDEDFSLHPEGNRKARQRKRENELGSRDLASGELWFWSPRLDP